MPNNTTKKTATPAAETTVTTEKATKPMIPKDIDPNQIIIVLNGFQGKLVYESPRTHEVYRWDAFGDEQEIELRELRNAKSSAKKFFMNNWFYIIRISSYFFSIIIN